MRGRHRWPDLSGCIHRATRLGQRSLFHAAHRRRLIIGKLVNLGSLCIDHVYRVPRVAAVGETLASTRHQIFPGGKGLNQSLAARKAGADVVHVGCIGADGGFLVDLLEEQGVSVQGIRVVVDEPSGHAVIQVTDAGSNAIVIAGGANRCLTEADIDASLSRLLPGDWLLLQNEINQVATVLERAAAQGARIAFNVAPVDGRESGYDFSGVDLLIVNEVESRALLSQ
ncbi:MAG: PfkB family carbohydrate kinase, partial [Pseudomonadales bacterium]